MHYRIFRDPEINKLIDSDPENIITLGKYYPKYDGQYKDMDTFSHMVLDTKKDETELEQQSGEYYYYKKAINYFTIHLRSILSKTEEFVICVIPTHAKGRAPSGIRTIAKRLCSPPIIDGTDVLLRAFEIPKKAIVGSRDLQNEIESLIVSNVNIIRDRQVLLMDDITTTGTSLKAGKYRLALAGAKIVVMLALARTAKTQKNGSS
jgi:hypothetical protein